MAVTLVAACDLPTRSPEPATSTLASISAPPDSSTPASPTSAPRVPLVDPDPPAARDARRRLVEHLGRDYRIFDRRVLAALEAVPRHRFVTAWSVEEAYANMPLPIGHGQTISQPLVVALMTEALRLTGRERVLEVGTGSGYQAAILSLLCARVDSIEIVEPLGEAARARLAALGYTNVVVRIGDGYEGWPDHAPFDRILLTAAPPSVPAALLDQLADGGLLVAPVGERFAQRLVRLTKRGRTVNEEELGAVAFVPMVHDGR